MYLLTLHETSLNVKVLMSDRWAFAPWAIVDHQIIMSKKAETGQSLDDKKHVKCA
jgi:hypothetical protein